MPLGKPLLAALDRMGHGGLVLDTAGQVIRPIRSIAPAILLGAGLTAASAPALSANDQFEPRIREAGQTLAMSNAAVAALDPQQRDQLIEFIIGNTLFTLTHELGHAVISEFQLPVIGREEDAADAFATLALLHVGSDFAHRVLEDAARGLLTLAARDVKMGHEPVFYDEHGLDQQRAYQITCFMAGSDPRGFRTLAEQVKLPPERQPNAWWDVGGRRLTVCYEIVQDYVSLGLAK